MLLYVGKDITSRLRNLRSRTVQSGFTQTRYLWNYKSGRQLLPYWFSSSSSRWASWILLILNKISFDSSSLILNKEVLVQHNSFPLNVWKWIESYNQQLAIIFGHDDTRAEVRQRSMSFHCLRRNRQSFLLLQRFLKFNRLWWASYLVRMDEEDPGRKAYEDNICSKGL